MKGSSDFFVERLEDMRKKENHEGKKVQVKRKTGQKAAFRQKYLDEDRGILRYLWCWRGILCGDGFKY